MGRSFGQGGGAGGSGSQSPKVPNEFIFSTFYEGGHLKRAIFIETAQKAAAWFNAQGMTASSLRNFFQKLLAIKTRLKMGVSFDSLKERVYDLVRYTHYQANRKSRVISPAFADFVKRHVDVVSKSEMEFLGFVEYVTSILAYSKQS